MIIYLYQALKPTLKYCFWNSTIIDFINIFHAAEQSQTKQDNINISVFAWASAFDFLFFLYLCIDMEEKTFAGNNEVVWFKFMLLNNIIKEPDSTINIKFLIVRALYCSMNYDMIWFYNFIFLNATVLLEF